MDARVARVRRAGRLGLRARVVQDGLPGVNGIAIFDDRIFVDEVPRSWATTRDLSATTGNSIRARGSNLPGPNGMCVGPDRRIFTSRWCSPAQIGRVPIDGLVPSRCSSCGLAFPASVSRCGPDRMLYVSEGGNGQITAHSDPSTRDVLRTVASCPPWDLDISRSRPIRPHLRARTTSTAASSRRRAATRGGSSLPRASWPPTASRAWETSCTSPTGSAPPRWTPTARSPGSGSSRTRCLPRYVRGLARGEDGRLLATTSEGRSGPLRPRERGRASSSSMGLKALRRRRRGRRQRRGRRVVRRTRFRDQARRLAVGHRGGLPRPVDVDVTADGCVDISDEARGEIVRIAPDGAASTLVSGLTHPQGLTSARGSLFIIDVGTRSLVRVPLAGGNRQVIATELPVGSKAAGFGRRSMACRR